MTDKENIISKIQKLLNVSKENGASENEAMVAAERAQKLLSEHKLSLKDVEQKKKQYNSLKKLYRKIISGKTLSIMQLLNFIFVRLINLLNLMRIIKK